MNPQIEIILTKYLSRSASAEELDILERWIDTPEGKVRFQQYAKTNFLINYSMNDPDTEKEVEELLKKIRRSKSFSHRFRTTPYLRYAAAVVVMGMFIAGYFIKERFSNASGIHIQPVVVDNAITKGTDRATLTMEDGSTVTLGKGTTFQSKNAKSNGEEIIYSDDNSNIFEMASNILTVPRGGQFFLTLEDGTKVWLNSETQLKYPVAFRDGERRIVELIYGEAYFDVSPSSDHKGARFQVDHSEQTVEVMGTEFNIKAYTDENVISTTLVEGKVALGYDGKTQNLLPGQQFRYNARNKTTSLSEVDVFDVVSWKEGVFSFDHASLEEIMKVLERWYDMEVVFEDTQLKEVRYNGTINKKFEIEDILRALMETKTIQTYEINKKTIVLK